MIGLRGPLLTKKTIRGRQSGGSKEEREERREEGRERREDRTEEKREEGRERRGRVGREEGRKRREERKEERGGGKRREERGVLYLQAHRDGRDRSRDPYRTKSPQRQC